MACSSFGIFIESGFMSIKIKSPIFKRYEPNPNIPSKRIKNVKPKLCQTIHMPFSRLTFAKANNINEIVALIEIFWFCRGSKMPKTISVITIFAKLELHRNHQNVSVISRIYYGCIDSSYETKCEHLCDA